MKDFNILTPGEKIKKIRDELNIKQEDLTGGEITRNLISILENNKANLTDMVAKVLTENINRIYRERNIPTQITEEYLSESVVSQAKKIASEYIEYINNLSKENMINIKDKLYEINLFCKNYKLEEKKAELYTVIGKKLKLNRQYVSSFDYYLKAFESTSDKEMTINSLLNLGVCSIYLSKYEEAIDYFNLIIDLESTTEEKYYAHFNNALCYKKLGDFEKALSSVNEIIENYNDILSNSKKEYIAVNLLMGACLYELKSYNKAIKFYKDLLKSEYLGNDEVLILSSLSDVYRALKDYSNLEKICAKISKKIDSENSVSIRYEGEVYISLAKNLREINKIDESTILLLNSLESFKSGRSALCFEDVEKLFKDLLDIFIQNSDEEKINYLRNELLELIGKGSIPKMNAIVFKFIKYYSFKGENKEINNLVDFLAV